MNSELDKKLCEKYPKIFAQRDLPKTETCLYWGMECGDGWYWLIDQLCYSIQGYVDSHNEGVNIRQKAGTMMKGDRELRVEAAQVKAKFGSLRFYINYGDDHIYGMIWLAESMSKGICEMCGTTENVSSTKLGWITYLCPKCHEERKVIIRSYEV